MSSISTPAQENEALRGGIESQYNGLRQAIEENYVLARGNLEQQYHADLTANRLAKEDAMGAAGLNRDGSNPYGRPTDGTPADEGET